MYIESTETSWGTKLRRNYNLLLFLVTSSVLAFLWGVLMVLNFISGTLFTDSSKLGMDLFVVFIFPLITIPIISGLALLIAKLLDIPVIRWLVILGLGVAIPIVAFVWVYTSHIITRKLYIGRLESKGVTILRSASTDKLVQLKEMLDQGLITQKDFELKKIDILAKM